MVPECYALTRDFRAHCYTASDGLFLWRRYLADKERDRYILPRRLTGRFKLRPASDRPSSIVDRALPADVDSGCPRCRHFDAEAFSKAGDANLTPREPRA